MKSDKEPKTVEGGRDGIRESGAESSQFADKAAARELWGLRPPQAIGKYGTIMLKRRIATDLDMVFEELGRKRINKLGGAHRERTA
jgi:hypothetical protein